MELKLIETALINGEATALHLLRLDDGQAIALLVNKNGNVLHTSVHPYAKEAIAKLNITLALLDANASTSVDSLFPAYGRVELTSNSDELDHFLAAGGTLRVQYAGQRFNAFKVTAVYRLPEYCNGQLFQIAHDGCWYGLWKAIMNSLDGLKSGQTRTKITLT